MIRCRYYRKGYCTTAQCQRGERLCCSACPLMRECRRRGQLCKLYMRKESGNGYNFANGDD